jgi:hypothetical protein
MVDEMIIWIIGFPFSRSSQMTTVIKKASLALVLGASVLAAASPAEAQRYGGGYSGRDNGGSAVVAGIAGLAVGAALASNGDRGYDDRVIYDSPYGYEGGSLYRPGYGGYYEQRGYYRDDRRGYYGDDRHGGDRDRGYDRGYRVEHRR